MSNEKLKEEAPRVINMSVGDELDMQEYEKRHLYINEGISEEQINDIVYNIMKFNKDDIGVDKNQRKPILLYMNTPGGSVIDGFGVVDAILTSETPVYTINQALCASMGFLIFIAGKKRYSMPHAEFLLHDGSSFTFDSTAKLIDQVEFDKKRQEMIKQYVVAQTKISEELYDENYRKEWWMLADEAKELGVATDIISVDCDLNDIL